MRKDRDHGHMRQSQNFSGRYWCAQIESPGRIPSSDAQWREKASGVKLPQKEVKREASL